MKKILFLALATCLFSCEEKENPALIEARAIHGEAHEIMESVEVIVDQSDSLINILNAQKATSKYDAAIDSTVADIQKAKADFATWEENLVDVPGFAHEHHEHKEGEHHHHDHKKSPDLSPEQLLEVQKETKKEIVRISEVLTTSLQKFGLNVRK